MTEIKTSWYARAKSSTLARRAEKIKFKAKYVTFSEEAPNSHPKKHGWVKIEESKFEKNVWTLESLALLEVEAIWYRTSTRGGHHQIYLKGV